MLSFKREQFARIFPFYIILDEELKIRSVGEALIKLIPDIMDKDFNSIFEVYRPQMNECTYSALLERQNELLVIEQQNGDTGLRCQIEFLENPDQVLLIGSPWFSSVEDVLDKGLVWGDFAIHDPILDLLHVLKTQEIANSDMKELVKRLNRQKKELKAANLKISDIALFPTQNPDPIIRIDFNGKILQQNPAAEMLASFELDGKKLEQDKFWKRTAGQIRSKNERQTLEVIANDEIYSFIIVSQEEAGYHNIYGRQITKQKKIADELSSTANRLSSLIRNLYAGVLLEDENRHIALVNKEFCDIFGIPAKPESLLGTDCSQSAELSKHLFSDPKGFVARIDDLLKEKEPVLNELLEMKDGRFLERDFIPIWTNKKYSGHLWLYVDVTEKISAMRQVETSEKRYRDVFENSLALITTHDLEGRILSVNPRVSELFGFTSEELIGRPLTDFMSSGDKPAFEGVYMSGILREKQISGVIKVTNKEGLNVYTLFNNFLKEEKGEDPYIIGYGVDITDRVNAENELKKAKLMTEELSGAKQEFLANMSHEIRTPLNAIIGMSNQMLKTSLTIQQSKFANTITEASDHLLSIVNDILDMSKIDAGKLAIETKGFEPKKLIDQAIQMFTYKAQEKGLKIEKPIVDKKVSNVLIGDPQRISQVLFNLMSNAVKYTQRGKVILSCDVLKDEVEQQKICLKVKDTGVGMDEDFLKRLFEKFSQDRNLDPATIGGTGLGMSITKKLVDLMEGAITVKSATGKGTVVSVTFTLAKGTKADLPRTTKSIVDKNFLSNKTILVVDDNENNRLVSSVILKSYGANILEAEDGRIAVDMVFREDPDAILMDLQMPELSGLEATRLIRKKGLKTPIIALTANVVKGERERCLKFGMNDYLSKPFKEQELLQKLALFLQLDLEIKKKRSQGGKKLRSKSHRYHDLTKLNEISPGNEAFVKRMLKVFCKNVPGILAEMENAIKAKDLEKVRQLAHKIKPSLIDLNISKALPAVTKLDALQNERLPFKEVSKKVKMIIEILEQVVDDINRDLES